MTSKYRSLVAVAAIVIMLLMSIALVWWLDPALHDGVNVALLWRNALPVFGLFVLIYGLSGRLLLSVVLGSAVSWLTFEVNALKVLNLGEPLMPGDLVLAHQVLHHMEFFAKYAGHPFLLLLVALTFIGLLWLLWRIESRWWRPGRVVQAGWALLALLLLVTLYRGDGPWPRIYSNDALPGFHLWDPMDSAEHVGFMALTVRIAQESGVALPPAANVPLVVDFARKHAVDVKARERRLPPKLPDIVVVQSEAFFDPGVIKGIDIGDFAPNFERLAANGISGSLTTPTYGGGTIRTEFETLTGYPMQAFPSIVYPYYGLASGWMPSIPKRLQVLGYTTTLFHPFTGGFWNRRRVMPQLGFQHSYYRGDFADAAHAGVYIADQALFDFVLAHLDRPHREPQYAFVITMENHGPWDADVGMLANVLTGRPLPRGLSPGGTLEMTYYLSHLVNGDQALGDFAKRLLARPRWTVLLFYGDHLPALPQAFADLGFDDGAKEVEQHTRYMLVSNRPLAPQRLDLSTYQLPGLLFDTIGLPEDGYLALASVIRQAWMQDHYQHSAEYGQVQFNAAQMEVNCRHKLDATGRCDAHTIPSSDRAKSSTSSD